MIVTMQERLLPVVFYLLVVETLGLWSPDSLEMLKSIALKVCAVLAVSFWKTCKNLLEQLSITLLLYNARMISSCMLAERTMF